MYFTFLHFSKEMSWDAINMPRWPDARALPMCRKNEVDKILQTIAQAHAEQGGKDSCCISRPFSAKSLIAQPASERKNNLCLLFSLTHLYLKSQTQPDLHLSHSVQFWQSEDVEPRFVGRAATVEFILGLSCSFGQERLLTCVYVDFFSQNSF